MEKKSRRAFLKESSAAALGLSWGGSLLATACTGEAGGQGIGAKQRTVLGWEAEPPLFVDGTLLFADEKVHLPYPQGSCFRFGRSIHGSLPTKTIWADLG